ncbi:versican core protein-like isoform X1 [Lates japonicus]|uniref:Versican core protein-like isoform X1 n=1 Tax=Lates japonicus TaxID=270547 RepID=A0AAD3RKD9_LATJO|nr:versican core protein-like isoform X1 [Lates japonicus]
MHVTFEPERPEEARGDQFETATPVRVEDIVVEKEEETEESVTPFDYGVIEIHTEEMPTEETSDAVTHTPDTYPDEVTDMVPYVFTDFDRVTTQEPDDQTTTTTPYTPHISSPAPTTPSGPVLPGVSQPVSGVVSVYEDMEGSASVGTDGAMQEGSADDVPPTPTSDSQLGVMTDETEIGGTEPPTFVPDTESRETTTQTQTEDFEGSASGEDEASGQEPPETPGLTSTVPPIHSTLHTQPPQPAAGTEVTEVPVVLPAVETAAETGSGAEQPSGEGEVSGEQGDVVDLPGEQYDHWRPNQPDSFFQSGEDCVVMITTRGEDSGTACPATILTLHLQEETEASSGPPTIGCGPSDQWDTPKSPAQATAGAGCANLLCLIARPETGWPVRLESCRAEIAIKGASRCQEKTMLTQDLA